MDGTVQLHKLSGNNSPNDEKFMLRDAEITQKQSPVTAVKHRPVRKSYPISRTVIATCQCYTTISNIFSDIDNNITEKRREAGASSLPKKFFRIFIRFFPLNLSFIRCSIVADANGCVKCWHYPTNQCLYTIRENRQVLGLAYHSYLPKFVTMGDDAKLILYDEETKMQERVFHARSVRCVYKHTCYLRRTYARTLAIVDEGEEYFVRFVRRETTRNIYFVSRVSYSFDHQETSLFFFSKGLWNAFEKRIECYLDLVKRDSNPFPIDEQIEFDWTE